MKEVQKIKIALPVLFSFQQTLSFLDRGFDECLYVLTNNSVAKRIELSDGEGVIRISQVKKWLEVILYKDKITRRDVNEVRAFVIDWFDMDRDIKPFYALLKKHKILNHLVYDYFGSRLIGIPNLFEALCWAIIGQQINLTFAYKLKRALVEECGEKTRFEDQVYYAFPSPKSLFNMDRDVLVKMKFSRQKIMYLYTISNAFINNDISKSLLQNCKSKQARIEKLTDIKGIGIWSANYVLMKCLRDVSCITYGDSGLNKAIYILFATDKKPSKEAIDSVFKDFKGWESYLNFYLWKTLGSRL